MCVCVCVCVCWCVCIYNGINKDVYLVLCVLVAQLCLTSWPHGLEPASLFYPWNSPGKNTGMVCHSSLQRVFPTQVSNPGLPHCRQIVYHLSHKGSPSIKLQETLKVCLSKWKDITWKHQKRRHRHEDKAWLALCHKKSLWAWLAQL